MSEPFKRPIVHRVGRVEYDGGDLITRAIVKHLDEQAKAISELQLIVSELQDATREAK